MSLIWATRGRAWGFRFLLDGGFDDPLPAYEQAFAGMLGEPAGCQRVGEWVALRFPDPLDRQDAAGRVIPHDFVVLGELAGGIAGDDDGRDKVWPLVSDLYAKVWSSAPPAARWPPVDP